MSLLRQLLGQRRDIAALSAKASGEDGNQADPWAYEIAGLIAYVEKAEAAEGRTNQSYSAALRRLIRVAHGEEAAPTAPSRP